MQAKDNVQLFDETGGLLIGQPTDIESLHRLANEIPDLKQDMQVVQRPDLLQRINALTDASSTLGIATNRCGVVDIHALLSHYLNIARTQGARVLTNHRISAIETQGGAIKRAFVNESWINCDVIINAAGFAANTVADMAGLDPLPITPSRRHLFVTERWEQIDPNWPFVWDISHGLYFRPESGGLLMCACDQTPWDKSEVPVEPTMRLSLAEKFSTYIPQLAEARPAHAWAGLRVLTPDNRFIIGEDPRLQGFVWAAGLGGHGMTPSHGVGQLVARVVTGKESSEGIYQGFSPKRLLTTVDESFAA